MPAILLAVDHILNGRKIFEFVFAPRPQTAAQDAGVVHQHPIFDIAILQDVQDVMGYSPQQADILWICFLVG